jgi:hypothetical protein
MAEQIRLDEGFRPSYRPDKHDGGMDPEMRRMGIMAAGLGAGLALLIGAATLLRNPHHVIPVIEPDAGPVRVKPLDPGGMKVTGADMGAGLATGQGPQLAPAAEQPEIRALKVQVQQMKRQLAKQAADTAQAEKLAQLAAAMPKPATPAAAARVVPVPPVAHASATARIELPAPVAVAPSAPIEATGTRVQFAAFNDEAAARTAWASLAKQAPDLVRPHRPEITRITAGGHTMYRLRTGGFSTVAEAASFCAKVRARGGACSIAAF